MTERPDYETLAQDIKLEDITSCEHNANILRMIRDGDPNWTNSLYIMSEDDNEDMDDFLVAEGDDLGWLGYFVGKSEVMEKLYICYLPEGGDEINRFFDGMSQNRSIKILNVINDIGVDGWSRLGSFFENNPNLARFSVEEPVVVGQEGMQILASALGRMHHNSLKRLSMNGTGISDEGFTMIATALRLHPQLESLALYDNNIGRDGCISLANTLSSWPYSNNLESLNLGCNVIDDGGLQALVGGLMDCSRLKDLYLEGNPITADALTSLFPLLQSEGHSLQKLDLCRIDFGDDGAIVLAESLRGNRSLKELLLSPSTSGISVVGWSAFSKLLCDTSTINNTYLSHHTLTKIGDYGDDNEVIPKVIQRMLTTNRYQNRQGAAFYKILQSHPDLDMEPFFELKMQFLPSVMSWFDRAPTRPCYGNPYASRENKKSASRKLFALYKFVRAMPDLTVTGYWEGRVIDIEAKKRMLDEEEAVAWERLGGRPIDASKRKRMRHE